MVTFTSNYFVQEWNESGRFHNQATRHQVRGHLRSAHKREQVQETCLATSRCNKSRNKSHPGNQPFLSQNLVAGTAIQSLRLVPRIQTGLNFWHKSLRLVPPNASCELTTPCDQSLRVNSSGDQLHGVVAGTTPLVCADL